MNLAAHGSIFILLLLLVISTFQLTGALSNVYLAPQSRDAEAEVEKVSGKDNVEQGELSIIVLTKLGYFFGLQTSSSGSKQWSLRQLSPAQAPEPAVAESPSSLLSLHKLHLCRRAPSPHRSIPNRVTERSKTNQTKPKHLTVAISVSVLAMLAVFGVMAMLLLWYRKHQKSSLCNSSNKVSFDLEPEMLYLDSLAQFLACDSDHKLSSESKSAELLQSNLTSTLPREGIALHSNSNSKEEDASHAGCSFSDGNESFHSVCCSHYSNESISNDFEQRIEFVQENGHLTCSKLGEFPPQISKELPSSSNFDSSNLGRAPPFKSNNRDNIDSERLGIRTNQESSMPVSSNVMNSQKVEILQTAVLQPSPSPLGSNGSIPNPPPPPPPPLPPCQSRGSFAKLAPNTVRVPKSPVAVEADSQLLRLKPLHWDKVRASSDRSMVWDKIRSSSFVLDEKTIESLFCYNMHYSTKDEEAKSKNSSPIKQVLDHKRLQNLTILLKPLNATAEHVCSALLLGSGLSIQQLEALAKMAPTMEEEEKLCKYDGDMTVLGPTEKFLRAMLNIPFAFSRVEVMLYKETFEDEVIHLKNAFATLEEACKELRSSRLFLRLLEAVLKTGNRMNVGTMRGGARAFKLDALLKLTDVKGTDGKTTLLHFVVQEMIKFEGLSANQKNNKKFIKTSKPKISEELEEDCNARELELVPALSSELSNVKKAASMDLDVLTSSVLNLLKGMSRLAKLVEDVSSNESDASFVNSMRSFQEQGDEVLRVLKGSEDRVLRLVREITEYYHGYGSKDEVNPLRIFAIVSDFLGMLDRVCKELKSSKSQQTLNQLASIAKAS